MLTHFFFFAFLEIGYGKYGFGSTFGGYYSLSQSIFKKMGHHWRFSFQGIFVYHLEVLPLVISLSLFINLMQRFLHRIKRNRFTTPHRKRNEFGQFGCVKISFVKNLVGFIIKK